MKSKIEIELKIKINWIFRSEEQRCPNESGKYFILLDKDEPYTSEYEVQADYFNLRKEDWKEFNEDYILAWSKIEIPTPDETEINRALGRTE